MLEKLEVFTADGTLAYRSYISILTFYSILKRRVEKGYSDIVIPVKLKTDKELKITDTYYIQYGDIFRNKVNISEVDETKIKCDVEDSELLIKVLGNYIDDLMN